MKNQEHYWQDKYIGLLKLPKEEEDIILSIFPNKLEEFKNNRAKIVVEINEEIIIKILAKDNTSFRAALNSFLRFYNMLSKCMNL